MTNTHSPFTIHNSEPTEWPVDEVAQRGQAKAPCGQFTILLLSALSLALSLHALAAENLWEDEIFTAIFASRPPAELVEWTANDIHPPLYYLLAGAFTRLTVPLGTLANQPTPASDWLWRFPSVIAGVLTVAVTYRLTFNVQRSTFNVSRFSAQPPLGTPHASRVLASSAALLLCLAPIAIKYSQEARMHALFMFLSTLSTWLFFRALARPQQGSRWLAYALAITANIYTMYFGFLILVTHAASLLFLTIQDHLSTPQSPPTLQSEASPWDASRSTLHAPRLIGFTASIALAFLLYAPWWPVLFNILRKRAAVGAIEGGVGSPLAFVPGVVRALGPMPELVAWGFLLLFIIGLISLARRYWPVAAFAGLWLGLPVALPIFLGDPRALQFRYAFVLPVYLIVIAYAVVRISESANERMSQWRIVNYSPPSTLHPPPSNLSTFQPSHLLTYFTWLLATLSFIATLGIYNQTKPDWRDAAAYLDQHTTPNDLILIGPLWDEGRFIDYYYRGQAQLLTPAALVTNIEGRAEILRATGGRVWAVNRFTPAESPAVKHIVFPGVVVSEPQLTVYEPAILTEATLDLARQAIDAAYPWAAEMEAQGVLNPDPRTAKAAALRAWGDALVAAGRPEEAIEPYQTAVDIFPGWVSGYLALAETQETVGNLPAAAEAYRQAVAFNLKWHGPPADEAAALVEAGQWATAVEKYHRLIDD